MIRMQIMVAKIFIISAYHASILLIGISYFFQKCHGNSTSLNGSYGCDCMGYWMCIKSRGSPFSYCGLSETNVCCFVANEGSVQAINSTSFGSKRKCGQKSADSGQEGIADPAEWPWHAAILEKQDDLYVCGGSLVDENWVLTAAHCIDDYVNEKGSLKVRLGEYDVTSTREILLHEEYDVAQLVVHPAFNNSTLAHDIALLELRQPAQRRPHIDIVCLPQQGGPFYNIIRDTDHQMRCLITGWGRQTEEFAAGQVAANLDSGCPFRVSAYLEIRIAGDKCRNNIVTEHSVVLKEVPVPLWENDACEAALQKQFGPNYHLPRSSICAGAEGKDACDGDGGGPLVCEENAQWYQVGVISFGIGCGRKNTPGVYTRVDMHEQWITDTILQHRESSNKEI